MKPSLSQFRDRLRVGLERARSSAGRLRQRAAGVPALAWIGRHWYVGIGAAVVAVAVFAVSYAESCGFAGCPSATSIQDFRPREGSRVLDRKGASLGRLEYVRRVNVPLDSVPEQVRQAFLAVEDRRFFEHDGIDWRSVLRAAFRNVRELGVAEGFSTITMQVVRNAFIPELANERSLRRKLIEVSMAKRLERSLTKEQILELYLNVIYLGNGVYGVEAASRDLFGKSVSQLTLAESALLAALPKGPTAYSPRRHPERARTRRNLVLSLMAREGFVTAAEAAAGRDSPLEVEERGWYPESDATHALDPIREAVDSILGDRADRLGDLVIHSTIDARAQKAAERAVRAQARRIERDAESARGRREAEVEGAMVALDPATGAIRALVSGNKYERGGFNRALDAHRQPGSAFKPFVYAAALAAGMTPAEPLMDRPVSVETETGEIWEPANDGGNYAGSITMRRALLLSANSATVRLSERLGHARVISMAQRAGITSPLADVPSLALGSSEVTPLELVGAYAVFANGGKRVQPHLLERIETATGRVIWRADTVPPVPVLDPIEAFQMASMLQSVVDNGTAFEIRRLGIRGPVAGKTGTTNEGNDVWFLGFTPELVAGFWFGYDVPQPLGWGASGGRLAAPAWAEFYRTGWAAGESRGWVPPEGVVARTIDGETGLLANEFCPTTHREWFRQGTEPTRVCDLHHGSLWDAIEDFGGKIGETVKKIFGF
ncbi:MAG TPA: PBP1A family penicillin-binding protein [Gemmatimonadales bacterium]|nr:PBP1A family penicillin-binding protein [Gemmatimonadales bacterium]